MMLCRFTVCLQCFLGHYQRLPEEEGRKFPGVMIWKTTTATNMEKYGDPKTNARHSKLIRFLTYQVSRYSIINISIIIVSLFYCGFIN